MRKRRQDRRGCARQREAIAPGRGTDKEAKITSDVPVQVATKILEGIKDISQKRNSERTWEQIVDVHEQQVVKVILERIANNLQEQISESPREQVVNLSVQ